MQPAPAPEPTVDPPKDTRLLRPAQLLWLAGVVLAVILLRSFVLEVYIVIGTSMQPSLAEQEHLLVNKLVPSLLSVGAGDIVVFTHPQAPRRHLIKRVIAVAGQTVEIRAGHVFVDGRELGEDYVSTEGFDPADHTTPYTIPVGHFYMLGDNRSNSRDSRTFGAISARRIVGRACFVTWPFGHMKGL